MDKNQYLNNHEDYMSQALDLAKKGRGLVSPNPLVGCVIVKNGRVIGEGYHHEFGGNHAEVEALKNCVESPIDASLYVNLEPCSIYSKTPPCVKSIIENSISEVYIGIKDPNPDINGLGVEELKKAGIRVYTDILKDECFEINKSFFKWIKDKIPYVIAKVAQTEDGFMGKDHKSSIWITGKKAKEHTHILRSKVDSILVGRNTALVDNPSLTVREVIGKNPKRIILDTNRLLPLESKIFNDKEAETIILCSNKKFEDNKTSFCKYLAVDESNGLLDPYDILKKIGEQGITSILIEGGRQVHQSFIDADLIDEIYTYTGSKIIKDATLDSPLKLNDNWNLEDEIRLDEDILTIAKKKKVCLQES